MAEVEVVSKIICNICNKSFRSSAGLGSHKSFIHGIAGITQHISKKKQLYQEPNTKEKQFINYCPNCGENIQIINAALNSLSSLEEK